MTRLPAHRAVCVRLLLALIAIVLSVAQARAQASGARPVAVGTRVRVTVATIDNAMPDRRSAGEVTASTADSLTVSWKNGLRSTFSRADILRLEESRGPRSSVKRGLGLGVLGGALVGAAWGAITYEEDAFLDLGPGPDIVTGVLVFGAGGALLGSIIGAQRPHEGWARIDPRRLSVAPQLGTRHYGVRVSVRF